MKSQRTIIFKDFSIICSNILNATLSELSWKTEICWPKDLRAGPFSISPKTQINLILSLVLLLLIWRLSLRTTQEQIGNHLYIFKVKKDKQRDSKQPLIEPKTDNP